jgi:hypothetical protein
MDDEKPGAQFHQEIYELRPWYHNFDKLGLQTDFGDMTMSSGERWRRMLWLLWPFKSTGVEKGEKASLRGLLRGAPRSHLINQRHKETLITPFLQRCLDALGPTPHCLDLFCADGYYSCLMGNYRPDAFITGVDLDEQEIERAKAAATVLDIARAEFFVADVWEWLQQPAQYDLILVAGGLYHLTQPRELVTRLRQIASGYLVIQSVVTLETEAADYFVSPAPGWKHGSRFTHTGLKHWLTDAGWTVLDEARNELTGNSRLCDRGSSYFLCRVPQS